MIKSISIRNYRNLKDLELKSLGQINLITGKNNTGKSSILEAISIYASNADVNTLSQLLGERGENISRNNISKSMTEHNLSVLSSLFSEREYSFNEKDNINIEIIEEEKNSFPTNKSISLGFIRYISEIIKDIDGITTTKRKKITNEIDEQLDLSEVKIGFEIKFSNNTILIPLEEERLFYRFNYRNFTNETKIQYIKTRNIEKDINGKLFDNITLTDKEVYVIDALKIIEPTIERLAFIEESSRDRSAVIKLNNKKPIYPLRSMGDGINRILTIILAIVNCDNGYVLIDEFENGLHYSVQKDLWNIIFELAEKLNIQIFATTHSEDCINGFEQALNNSVNNSVKGKLIRLDYQNDKLSEVIFNSDELKIANDLNIETR